MSMQSYQIDQLSLCLHWKGQKCALPKGQGVVGCMEDGQLHIFDPADAVCLDEHWSLLIGYERAHGWLSISQLRAPVDLCINGQKLSDSPLMMKESACMMPPQNNASIELFLTESLSELDNAALDVSLDGIANEYAQYATAEYGLVSADGKLVEINRSYCFGAIRFEIADDECWVFVADGALFVNGFQRVTSQIFVGDQLQWESHYWLVQGCSTQQRVEAQVSELCLQIESLSSLDLENDLFPADQGLQVLQQQISGDQVAIAPEEMAAFRNKLAVWLHTSPSLNPLDEPTLHHPMDHDDLPPTDFGLVNGGVSHLALLRLGRRNHFWKSIVIEPQPSETGNTFRMSENTGLSLGPMKTFSTVFLIGILIIGVLGFLGLMAFVLLL